MKWIKLLIVFCLFVNVSIFSSVHPVSANLTELEDIEMFLDQVIQEKIEENQIPNLTVSVVSDGKVIFKKGYGYANWEDQRPVDPDSTMFRIGSVSKLFTWTAVMQLVEEGKLDLNEDINTYLDFEIPSSSAVGDKEALEPITLFHLMTHTPGFEDYMTSVLTLSEDQFLPLNEYIREYLPARVFPLGEVTAYSNYGTALAGYIVERVTGLPFEEYIEEEIYQPLGMENSTFRQPIPEGLSSNMAIGYRYVDGKFQKAAFEFMPEPAGSMSSNAEDMAQFMLAYLEGGKNENGRILEEKTVEEMFAGMYTQHPELNGISYGFLEKTTNNEHVLFHPGGTMLFVTGLYLLPEHHIGLFISYSGGNYLIHTELFQEFMDRYFPSKQTIPNSSIEGAQERSKQFVGEYHQNRKSFTTSDRILSILMSVIQVDVNDEGDLLVTYLGTTNRFVEVKEGIYRNTREDAVDAYGDFRTIVFKEDPFGNIMLAVDGAMTYAKAPWYERVALLFYL